MPCLKTALKDRLKTIVAPAAEREAIAHLRAIANAALPLPRKPVKTT
jgi:hypothetical protein